MPRPDADRDFDDVAAADAGVEAFRDDVGEIVIDDHIHPDIGMRCQEAWQHRHDDCRDRMLGRGDADGTGRLPAQSADRIHPGGNILQCRAQRAKHRLARFSRRHRARGPRQQPHPEPLFESLHGVAQRRLGHAELGRRAGKAALLGHDREGGKVVQIVSFHLCTTYISLSGL